MLTLVPLSRGKDRKTAFGGAQTPRDPTPRLRVGRGNRPPSCTSVLSSDSSGQHLLDTSSCTSTAMEWTLGCAEAFATCYDDSSEYMCPLALAGKMFRRVPVAENLFRHLAAFCTSFVQISVLNLPNSKINPFLWFMLGAGWCRC